MQFVHQSLTWAFFLVLVPVLIHLINLMRHKRVEWAPMEFLLASYKKQRRWIWLRQLILLLMRMAAIAAVVAMLAQLITQDQWASLFGGNATHHYVLLDDSYSMGDNGGGQSGFDRAKEIVGQIAERASGRQTTQKFTLIRFSRAEAHVNAEGDENSDETADFTSAVVDGAFKDDLDAARRSFDVTQLAATPNAALDLAQQLMAAEEEETRLLYVVSDFRTPQWQNPADVKKSLTELENAGAEIHLVRCVPSRRPNLGITAIYPAEGTRAAGVPLFVNVKVKNFGEQPVKDVQLKANTHYFDPAEEKIGAAGGLKGKVEELPTEIISEIMPGETKTSRIQVFFATSGQHVIEAILPTDAVLTDNRRYFTLDIADVEKVLVVDDSADGGGEEHRGHYYLNRMLAPSPRVKTGMTTIRKSAAFLRDTTPEELGTYGSIYLLNVRSLDVSAIKNLTSYVDQGGGLAVFAGPDIDIEHYNSALYSEGEGLLPAPLGPIDTLESLRDEGVPDVEIGKHPMFQDLGQKNLLLGFAVESYLRVGEEAGEEWRPSAERQVEVLAKLRNKHPLILERKYGKGRVIQVLTTLSPEWNNFAKNGGPTYVAMIWKLQAYLAAPQRADLPRPLGSDIRVSLDASEYRPEVKFIVPGSLATSRRLIEKRARRAKDDSVVLDASLSKSSTEPTDRMGIYETWAIANDGRVAVARYTLNVDPAEGELDLPEAAALEESLKPLPVKIHESDEVQYNLGDNSGTEWSFYILLGLVLLLMVEQAVAYSASYHPQRGGATA